MLLSVLALATAGVVLRNDTNYADEYDASDQVAWLEYPECAIAVLEASPSDLPLTIDHVQVYLGSNTGNQDGSDTLADVGLQVLEDGEEPDLAGGWDWGPEAFYLTVSSLQINELSLVDKKNGLFPLSYTGGRLAVWVCPPDPATGESWPRTNDRDTSGIVIDTSSPSAGSYLYFQDRVQPLSQYVQGAWIIRASAGAYDGGGDDTGDGGGDDTGDGGGDDTGDAGPVQITSVTPASAAQGASVDIAIVGEGFEPNASVTIGGLACGSVVVSGTTAITARSPGALQPGTYDVVVQNVDGSTDTLEAAFTVTGGCGCAAGPGAGAGAALAAALAALARRRR